MVDFQCFFFIFLSLNWIALAAFSILLQFRCDFCSHFCFQWHTHADRQPSHYSYDVKYSVNDSNEIILWFTCQEGPSEPTTDSSATHSLSSVWLTFINCLYVLSDLTTGIIWNVDLEKVNENQLDWTSIQPKGFGRSGWKQKLDGHHPTKTEKSVRPCVEKWIPSASVLEGRMEGTRTRGRQSATTIDWMKSNDVEYEHIKKKAHDREDWHYWRPGPAWKSRALKKKKKYKESIASSLTSDVMRNNFTCIFSHRIDPIHFLARCCKRRPAPNFSFVNFSFADIFINCCLGFLCCHLVVVVVVLLAAAKWLVRRPFFAPDEWLEGKLVSYNVLRWTSNTTVSMPITTRRKVNKIVYATSNNSQHAGCKFRCFTNDQSLL